MDNTHSAASFNNPAWENVSLEWLEQRTSRAYFKLGLLVVALACLVRIVVAVIYTDFNPATAEIWEYGSIAIDSLKYGAIVRVHPLPNAPPFVFPTAYMPPLTVFLWMAVFWILGVTKAALAAMTAFNVACATAIVHYVMRIARTLFDSTTIALTAGIMVAFYPTFVYSVTTYHALNLYILLLLLIFDFSVGRSPATLRNSVIAGIFLGLATLERTEYLVLGSAMIASALLSHRKFSLALASFLVAAMVVLPWTVRNYVVLHRFIPVANVVGYAMFKGFNPEANGSGYWVDRNMIQQKLLGKQLAAVPLTPSYENDVDDVYKAAAHQFVEEHPFKAFVELPLRKISLFWLFDVYDPKTRGILYQLGFWPVFVFSVLGLAKAGRMRLFVHHPGHRAVALMFLAETALMASYAVHSRYRMNVEPFLFCYAALGLWAALAWSKKNGRSAHGPDAIAP